MPAIAVGATSIHYESSGAGDWLVMLHEIGGTLETWTTVAKQLEPRLTVLRYDQRGAGRSQRIAGDFRIETHIDDLTGLLAALGVSRPCHFAGVAIGAAILARLAARRPEIVRSLVLACPAPGVSADRVRYLKARADAVEREGMASTVESSLGNSYPPEVRRDPNVFAAYEARFLTNDPKSYAAINRAFAGFDATADLPAIRCPTLVLAGKHDRLRPPAFVRDVAAKIPAARYAELDSGHIMPIQAPAEMAAAMLGFYEQISAG